MVIDFSVHCGPNLNILFLYTLEAVPLSLNQNLMRRFHGNRVKVSNLIITYNVFVESQSKMDVTVYVNRLHITIYTGRADPTPEVLVLSKDFVIGLFE